MEKPTNRENSRLMRKLIFSFCLFSVGVNAQTRIDSLQENIAELKQLILKENKVLPAHYYITNDEIVWLDKISGETKGKERSVANKEYVASSFSNAITKGDGVLNFVAQDTVTFYDRKIPMLNLLMSFKFKNTSKESEENQTVVAVYNFYFVLVNGKMKLAKVTLSHRDSETIANGVFRAVRSNNSRAFSSKSSEKCFTSSYDQLIPFKRNKLWGLVNLQGQEVLSPQFDTIFPFDYNYAKVAIKGEYNLLGKNMKLLLPANHKYLKKVERGYIYADADGVWYDAVTLPKEKIDYSEVMELMPPSADNNSVYAGPAPLSPADSIREKLFKEYYGDSKWSVQGEPYNGEIQYHLLNSESNEKKTFYGFSSMSLIGSDYLIGKRGDSSLVMTLDGKIIFGTKYVLNVEEPGYIMVFESGTRNFGVYCPYTNVYIAPKYAYIKAVDRDRFFIVLKSNGEIGYIDSEGKELFD